MAVEAAEEDFGSVHAHTSTVMNKHEQSISLKSEVVHRFPTPARLTWASIRSLSVFSDFSPLRLALAMYARPRHTTHIGD